MKRTIQKRPIKRGHPNRDHPKSDHPKRDHTQRKRKQIQNAAKFRYKLRNSAEMLYNINSFILH